MTNFRDEDHSGSSDKHLNCPECDFDEIIYYTTKEPFFCSGRCRQRARRRRHREYVTEEKEQSVTYLEQPRGTNGKDYEFEHDEYGRIAVSYLKCGCGRGIFTPAANARFAPIVCGDCNTEFRQVT